MNKSKFEIRKLLIIETVLLLIDNMKTKIQLSIDLNSKELKLLAEQADSKGCESVEEYIKNIIQEATSGEKKINRTFPFIKYLIECPSLGHEQYNKLPPKKSKERNKLPMWTLKNKFFPMKMVLRVMQNLTAKYEGGVYYKEVDKQLSRVVSYMRTELTNIEKIYDVPKIFSTGFPDEKKPVNRFHSNYYLRMPKKVISGMPYELGLLDVFSKEKGKTPTMVRLTEQGYKFSKLHNPVLDEYLAKGSFDGEPSKFSKEEEQFLYEHIANNTDSENNLYRFILNHIDNISHHAKNGIQAKNLDELLKKHLEHTLSKKAWGDKETSSIRGGIVSRMKEINLIATKYLKDGSNQREYVLTDNSWWFIDEEE